MLWLKGEYDQRVKHNEHLRRLRGRPLPERRAPVLWGHQLQSPSRAVTGVSWFEARAYARWLDDSMRTELRAVWPEKFAVRLTTEPQCERAARWAANEKGYDRRPWPWVGDEAAAPAYANIGRFPHRVAAVGLYEPTGPTIFDLAGNIWEWMDNAYLPAKDEVFDPVLRSHGWHQAAKLRNSEMLALRGGPWVVRSRHASFSFRGRFRPEDWDNDVGFRVVLCHAQNET